MYRPRMTSAGLELYRIGSNKTIWELDILESQSHKRTLEGAVTQVKVLGQKPKKEKKQRKKKKKKKGKDKDKDKDVKTLAATTPSKPSNEPKKEPDMPLPILAVVKGQTDKYGTLQQVIQDSSIETAAQATTAAKKLLTGVQETFSVTGPDINLIRAGDKVKLGDRYLIVTAITHDLGYPGSMDLDLAPEDKVRRDYFARSF